MEAHADYPFTDLAIRVRAMAAFENVEFSSTRIRVIGFAQYTRCRRHRAQKKLIKAKWLPMNETNGSTSPTPSRVH